MRNQKLKYNFPFIKSHSAVPAASSPVPSAGKDRGAVGLGYTAVMGKRSLDPSPRQPARPALKDASRSSWPGPRTSCGATRAPHTVLGLPTPSLGSGMPGAWQRSCVWACGDRVRWRMAAEPRAWGAGLGRGAGRQGEGPASQRGRGGAAAAALLRKHVAAVSEDGPGACSSPEVPRVRL